MAILLHGTTRQRAERIVAVGPDPDFIEPGGMAIKAGEFSTYVEAGPYLLLPPEDYARGKAIAFPTEGGPAILAIDVPDEIMALAADDTLLPLGRGLVQFDMGAGLEELLAAWPTLPKQIRPVEGT
jgi:hypothetical protein